MRARSRTLLGALFGRLPAALLLGALCHVLWAASPAAAAQKVTPRRIAVVVGNNVGMADEVELRYAEDDARKIERVLVDLGGYAQDDVHLVLGGEADEVRSVLREVVRQTESDPGALVFFYYSGHADQRDLHLDGRRLPLREVRSFLDAAGADVKVALVDACRSGALIRPKGASLGPAFDIDMVRPSGVAGTIVITSSSDDEVSQESDRLGGSFFTHYWVRGLYGDADADADDQVTLEEAYRFAHFQTVSQTIASSGGVQHPSYELDLSGEGAIVLANLARSTARVELSGGGKGAYYILDADRRFLLTEIAEPVDGRASVRLPPGRYRIKKREERRFRVVDVELSAGEVRKIADDDMEGGALLDDGQKGADASVTGERGSVFDLDQHGPIARLGARGMLFSSVGAGPSLQAGYRFSWRYAFVEPRVGLFSGARVDHPGILHVEADLGTSVGARLPVGPVALAAGLDAGLVFPQQTALPALFGSRFWNNPSGLISVAGQGQLFAEMSATVPGDILLLGRVHGGLAAYKLGPNIVTPPTFGASLGVGYAF